MIRWFARNDIAANFLIVAILLWGGYSAMEKVPMEVTPAIVFNEVYIDVPYRGGSPADLETAVILPIEKSLEGLSGVKSIISMAGNGSASVQVIAHDRTNPRELLEEVKTRVARITTFPAETEPPVIAIPDSSQWFEVITLAVAGDMDESDLLRAAQRVRDDLVEMPGISQAKVLGASPPEISIEADPMRLRDFGLTFADLSAAIQRSSLDLPAGQIQTDEGSLIIRSKGQAYVRGDFENIIIRNRDGAEVSLGKVARVNDSFEENRKIIRYNGMPCLLVETLRLGQENALEIAAAVRNYAATARERFPEGVELHVWDDSSLELEGRLGTLLGSLLQGSLLVLIILGLFLRPGIAFWVTLGIPVAFAGGFILMPWFGLTANVMSLFGFIIVVGIIVDDAIVTSENVYIRLREGMEPLDAVTLGTREVAVPVTFGAITTIVAFLPLMFFDGFYGAFTKQIPPVVAAVLLFSLIESKLVLPCHLKYVRVGRSRLNRFERFQKRVADTLEAFVGRVYEPSLRWVVRHRFISLAAFAAVAMAAIGYFSSGVMGFANMPSIDRNIISARIVMPRDTTVEQTELRVRHVAGVVDSLRREFVDPGTGRSIIGDMISTSGGMPHRSRLEPRVGTVAISVTDPGQRSEPGPKNSEIARRWTELAGEMPDVQSFWVRGEIGGGSRGESSGEVESLAIEIRGPAGDERDLVVDEIERKLQTYDGIADTSNDSSGNRDELVITIRPEGEALGLTQRELARQVRAAFFGELAQRVQRGRDDIRVMVRMPLARRQSLDTLDHLRIRTPAGGEAPFHSVATASFGRARSEVLRIDGSQVVTVYAQPADKSVDVVSISRNLAPGLDALLNRHPELTWRYSGYVAEHEETRKRTILGAIALFLALYALLAIPFGSLYQPFFVMLAVPFGAIGALIGHLILDLTPSYLSMFGILALAGVVVNDSLVMVDFINRKVRAGEDMLESVIHSGTRRFRPIILTSATTFAGLLPILFDRSLQAQILVPMAASLAFGILFATVITLYLIPSSYLAAEDARLLLGRLKEWYLRPFRRVPAAGGGAPGSPEICQEK